MSDNELIVSMLNNLNDKIERIDTRTEGTQKDITIIKVDVAENKVNTKNLHYRVAKLETAKFLNKAFVAAACGTSVVVVFFGKSIMKMIN